MSLLTAPATCLVRTKNCGIAEIDYLSMSASPLAALQTLAPALRYGITWPYVNGLQKGCYFPFITFTGVVTPRDPIRHENYGQAFADYLTEHNLGAVVTLPGRLNWTGNMIQIWVWRPDYDVIWALLAQSKEPIEEPVLAAPGLVEPTTAVEVSEVPNGT